MDSRSRRVERIASLLPYIMLVSAAAGLAATILMRRPDLTIFSLVLVVPLVLAATLLLADRNYSGDYMPVYAGHIRFQHLFLLNITVLLISLMFLVTQSTRPIAYFVLISISSGLILGQIVCRRPQWTDALILLQIVLLSLDLIWGLTLKYPLYFGDTDILVHMNLIHTIVQTGHVQTYYPDYEQYALYHIFMALGIDITGASIRTTVFILAGLSWQVGIVFAFLLFRHLAKSTRMALVACLLFAASSQVIFYGSYAIPRALAFVLFMGWLYLIVDKAQRDTRYVFLSVVVLAAMIMTHHLNVLYAIPVLFAAYVCQLFVRRFRQEHTLDLLFVYLLTIGAVSYFLWAASGMTGAAIGAIWTNLIALEEGIKSLSGITNGFGMDVVFGTLYYSFALLLCLLGIRTILKRLQLTDTRITEGAFGLAGFVLLVVYVPGFLYLFPLSDLLLTDRLSLMASPFVALLMAYGVLHLLRARPFAARSLHTHAYSYALPVVLIIIATFFSATSIGNAKDTNYLPQTKNVDSPYFTQSELDSFSFLAHRADSSLTFYTDYATSRDDYSFGIPTAQPYAYTYGAGIGNETAVSNRSIIRNISEVRQGYLVLRLAELQRKQSLGFLPPTGTNPVRYPISELEPQLQALSRSPDASEVYSDGDVEIYLVE